MNENFLGYNNFVWFTGVIEDRNDPEYLGRVRVRCFGFHTSDNNLLGMMKELNINHILVALPLQRTRQSKYYMRHP